MAKKKKNKKNSPLDLNQTLVQGAGISNKQYGGATSLSAGEWNGDLMTKPILDAMIGKKLTEKESDTTGGTKKNTKKETKKSAGYEEYLKDIGGNINDVGEDTGVLSEEDWKELNEQNTETKNTKTKKTKNTKIENTKQKKRKGEKLSVSNNKRNIFQRLFNKDGGAGKRDYVNDANARKSIGIEAEKYRRARREYLNDNPDANKKNQDGSYIDKKYEQLDNKFKETQEKRYEKYIKVKKKGLFNDKKMTRAEFEKIIKEQNLQKRGSQDVFTGDYYSPLEMNSREKYFSKKTKRKNSQGNSPYAYKERVDDNTPFYQVEEVSSTNKRPEKVLDGGEYPGVEVEGNVFDLIEKYGMIDAKKYGASLNLIGDEKPPQLLGAAASMAIDDFMKVQKEALYKAKMGRTGTIEENAIINNVKQLSTNMNNVGDFIAETFESADQGTESDGSSVANRYLRDIVFTQKTDEEGKPLTTMMVNNDHGLSIKFRDTEGVYTLQSLKENIFPKAFDSFEMLSKGMSTTKDEATSGMPFNETASKVLINNALKTEEQILSVIHDEESPLYQFLNDFAEGYPNANFDFAHIDSPNYNKEDLAPIVRDYALRKLRRQHSLYSNVKQDINTLSPEDIIKKFS